MMQHSKMNFMMIWMTLLQLPSRMQAFSTVPTTTATRMRMRMRTVPTALDRTTTTTIAVQAKWTMMPDEPAPEVGTIYFSKRNTECSRLLDRTLTIDINLTKVHIYFLPF
jgi:hypothetical protein